MMNKIKLILGTLFLVSLMISLMSALILNLMIAMCLGLKRKLIVR